MRRVSYPQADKKNPSCLGIVVQRPASVHPLGHLIVAVRRYIPCMYPSMIPAARFHNLDFALVEKSRISFPVLAIHWKGLQVCGDSAPVVAMLLYVLSNIALNVSTKVERWY